MSLLRLGALSVLGAAVASSGLLLACASESGDDDGASTEAVTQDRVVVVGKCRAPFQIDPNEALPPAEQVTQHELRDVTRDKVMMQADLVAQIRTVGKKRQVIAFQAKLGSVFARGQGTVTVAGTSAMATTIQTEDGKMEYEARTLTAPRSGFVGALSLNGETTPIGVAVLQREPATGRGWMLLGTHEDELLAVASGCTFDERAWAVLADTSCEAPLYTDAGADAGPSSCGAALPDAGADAAPDAAPKVDAGVDAAVAPDASTVDAGAKAPASEPAAQKKTSDEDPPSSDEGAENTPIVPEETPDAPATKKKSQGSSGCSASPSSPTTAGSDAAFLIGCGALLGLVVSRSRRRRA